MLGIGACVVVFLHANNLDAGIVADHSTIQAAPVDVCPCDKKTMDALTQQVKDANKKIDDLKLKNLNYDF